VAAVTSSGVSLDRAAAARYVLGRRTAVGGYCFDRVPACGSTRAVGGSLARLQRADGGLGVRDGAISTLQATWLGLRAAHLLDEHGEGES
jgi:hypothetical protein